MGLAATARSRRCRLLRAVVLRSGPLCPSAITAAWCRWNEPPHACPRLDAVVLCFCRPSVPSRPSLDRAGTRVPLKFMHARAPHACAGLLTSVQFLCRHEKKKKKKKKKPSVFTPLFKKKKKKKKK